AFRAIPSSESGRRELAEWLSSPHNPLTSRVFVNRVWQHLIGEGIVRTPDNFGATGQQPTHPELLDFLAWTFVHEDNWSVKKLVTRIATSRTFRMSVDSETLRDDPDNDLLTRAFHRPVDVEVFRDSVLAISGQLDLSTTGGLTIRKLTQYDNGYDHEQLTGPVRSVFVPAFRNSILPVFDVFNMANSNMVTGRRNISTLPTQGLFLMNSPFVLTQSRLAATRLLNSLSLDSGSTDELLSQISLTVLGRTPTSAEQRVMGEYLSHQGINEESLSAVFQSLFASIDFRYLE
ncbi:MAG: DUF1553 domain-containing protein, partial [Planctomycetaceae bacterium]|nr:DUF1553 domain-containing protein [Planctomycetaceae bacterium]